MDSQRGGDDIARFGQLFQAFMEGMTRASPAAQQSALRDRLDRHLGTDSATLPVISDSFAACDHVNVQVALSAYLAEDRRSHELVGLTGQQRHFQSLSELIRSSHDKAAVLAAQGQESPQAPSGRYALTLTPRPRPPHR
jgi:cell division protease FtsH